MTSWLALLWDWHPLVLTYPPGNAKAGTIDEGLSLPDELSDGDVLSSEEVDDASPVSLSLASISSMSDGAT